MPFSSFFSYKSNCSHRLGCMEEQDAGSTLSRARVYGDVCVLGDGGTHAHDLSHLQHFDGDRFWAFGCSYYVATKAGKDETSRNERSSDAPSSGIPTTTTATAYSTATTFSFVARIRPVFILLSQRKKRGIQMNASLEIVRFRLSSLV